ncbi:MAG: hypothetical protein LBJ59_07310 [Zoogloeaceae bacterium]|jgi:hypothetical protein|nr:hypothetical protein [Zoogloeaceae bacterium]
MVREKIDIEKAWEILFDRHDIAAQVSSNGSFRISANQINSIKEARLMAKFDQSSQLPNIFHKNNLSILPVTRGEYIIGPFLTHEKINYPSVKPEPVEIPKKWQTLDHTNLYSEASTLLFAYNSGIIKDALECSEVAFTVNGRMSSGNFDYEIDNRNDLNTREKITVQNAQIEIDAGYESQDKFYICEAKNIAVEEILIRQLYYPYRLWSRKISKPVVPVFLVFSNDVFHIFIYEFKDRQIYNSIKLLKYKAYTFADEEILFQEVVSLWEDISLVDKPQTTFPQADSFERILDLVSILAEKNLTRDEVTFKYEFDPRQTNYYISACEYLGLIERCENADGEREYKLSTVAQKIMTEQYKQKHLMLMQKILENPVFHKTFDLTIKSGRIPDRQTICQIMGDCNLSINPTTIDRRASTVRSWIDWILRLSV